MRSATILLLLLSAGAAQDRTALDILVGLLDDDATRAVAVARLDAMGVEGIPLLDDVRGKVRSDPAGAWVVGALKARGAEIRRRVLAGEREWFAKEIAPRLKEISADALWLLRADLGPDDEPILYFDAKTFEDPKRLGQLEYFVCPEREGQLSKGYECLAGMDGAEWDAFGRAFSAGRPLRMRWVVWGFVTKELTSALPWARPVLGDEGMKIGGNHDERENRSLPGHNLAIQIGVAIR